jgi:hypothetical protein
MLEAFALTPLSVLASFPNHTAKQAEKQPNITLQNPD